MCGIAGILQLDAKSERPQVSLMTNAMAHRGPDADGFYSDEMISLGHRRLSIIDLSTSANQPLFDTTGRFCIVFNGEIYNYLDVKKELSDYVFRTNGDTEVLLAGYIKWGTGCLERFKGMFAFAIWDKLDRSLLLARDRLGVKPLYYYQDDKFILFASEIRSILATGLVRKELYRSALPDYFSFQSFGYPLSPIKGITQIEAGSFLKIRNGSVAKGNYWEIGKQSSSIDLEGKADVQNEVRRLFRNSIQQRLISDVPIGAFLSGGIDSSAVVAMMAEVSSAKPSTFNISFSEKEFDEAPYAELVARKYNTDHHTIKLSKKIFLEALDQALSAVDSPSADGINTYVVSKAIREAGVTVALSGVGGDELFAGYPFFERYRRLYEYKGIFNSTRGLRKMMSSIIDKKDFPRRQRVASMLRADKVSIDRFYPEFRRILTTERISSIIRSDWDHITVLENELAFKKEILDALPALSQVSVADYLGYTQQTLLKDTDQMSMAVSLEVREPFFDHELIDFVLQVPDQIKRPVYPKSLLVESIKPMLPDEIVFRKKQGFLFPWKLWMKKEIYEFCNTRITRMSERDFINGAVLRNYWNRFQKGDPSVNWTELWLFVVLEYWMEKNGIQ